MSIGKRILHLRKDVLKMSQEEFGKPLGIKKGGLSKIETETSSVTDGNIFAICREYKINEEWLRYGTGNMYKVEDNDLDYLIAKYGASLSDAQRALVAAILKMDDRQRAAVDSFIDELISLRNS